LYISNYEYADKLIAYSYMANFMQSV
jgi:hypothetical protein